MATQKVIITAPVTSPSQLTTCPVFVNGKILSRPQCAHREQLQVDSVCSFGGDDGSIRKLKLGNGVVRRLFEVKLNVKRRRYDA